MTARCPRDGKQLRYTGDELECLHCGYREPCFTVGQRMTQPEVKELVRRVRLMSGSCKSRRHDECKVSTCECWHHDPKARQGYADHLRREAAEIEHRLRSTDADVYRQAVERAEELRRRADEVAP